MNIALKRGHTLKSVLVGALVTFTALTANADIVEPLPARVSIDDNGVDLLSGQLHMSATDLTIGQPGSGGLSYGRTWVDQGWRGATLGTISNDGTSYFISTGNESERFTESGGSFTSAEGTGATLAFDGGANKFTYTTADGLVLIFDKALAGKVYPDYVNQGVLVSITYPSGEVVTFHYKTVTIDSVDYARLQSVTNNFGYQLHFTYAVNGTPGSGQAASWLELDVVRGINNAVDYCAPTADTCSGFSVTWPSATYAGPTAFPTTVTDSLSRTTTYTYSFPRLSAVRWPGSGTDNITISYNSGRVSSFSRGFGAWSYSYSDNSGIRTTTITQPDGGQRVVTSNISTGLLTSDKTPLNKTTSFEYDGSGRLSKITAPEGNYVEYEYDSRGNLIETTRVAKSGSGLSNIVTTATFAGSCGNPVTCNKPTETTDARGNTTSYTYDSTHGGILTVTTPEIDDIAAQTRYTYAEKQARYRDSASTYANGSAIYRLIEIAACATESEDECDGEADETVTTTAWPTTSSPNNLMPTSITIASGTGSITSTTTFAYDEFGNLKETDGPLSGSADTTRFRYDAGRQLIGVIGPDPDGGSSLKHRAIRTAYNAYGLPTVVERGVVDSQSDGDWSAFSVLAKQETHYDAHGRPIKVRVFDGATVKQVVETSYDAVGRVECAAVRMNPSVFGALPTSACLMGTTGAYAGDRISKNSYDVASRVIKTVTAHGTSLAQDSAQRTYTDNGLVATLIDAKGNKTTYEYDGFDRLKKQRFPHLTSVGSSSTTDFEEYTYDAGSNVLTRRTRAQASGFDFTFQYAYDDLSRMTFSDGPPSTGVAFPDFTYVYDNFGRLTSVSQSGHAVTYAWDQLSRLLSETQPLGTVSYDYDAAGRRTRVTWPGSPAFYIQYDYDVSGAMTNVRENGATSGVGVLATYAYDDLGRRTSVARGNGAPTTYGYDGLSRLTSLTHNPSGSTYDQTYGFSYNPASQIATQTASNDAYRWTFGSNFSDVYASNGLNQITQAGSLSPTYGLSGNLNNDGTKTLGYDAGNRLLLTSTGASYAYDPLSRLYQASASGATTRFLYSGNTVIAEYDGSNALLRRYAHGAGVDEPVVWYEGTGTSDRRFLLADIRGSVVAVADASGDVTSINAYDEYGTPASGNIGRFQYTGQMWMAETGLYHYKTRAYSPAFGKFHQADPIGYADGMNLYAYVGNDPINFRDPLGLSECATGDEDCESEGPGGPSWGCAMNPTCSVYGSEGSGGSAIYLDENGNVVVAEFGPSNPWARSCNIVSSTLCNSYSASGKSPNFSPSTFAAWGGVWISGDNGPESMGQRGGNVTTSNGAPTTRMGQEATLRIDADDVIAYQFEVQRRLQFERSCQVSIAVANLSGIGSQSKWFSIAQRRVLGVLGIAAVTSAVINCGLVNYDYS